MSNEQVVNLDDLPDYEVQPDGTIKIVCPKANKLKPGEQTDKDEGGYWECQICGCRDCGTMPMWVTGGR